jgi:hypothetical protein
MKQHHNNDNSLANRVKKLSKERFISLSMLVISALCYGWIKFISSTHTVWDDSSIQLPDTEELQLFIDKKVTGITEVDQQLGNHLDNIIDDQAMQIKISGLTKNITTTREPSHKELNDFYQQHQEQYRQISSFQFTQYLLTNVRYGGQAVNMAHKILNTEPAKRAPPQPLKNLNTLEIDRLYGAEFSKKLVAIILQDAQSLPCWTKPITSKVGAHLICFKQADIGAVPKLDSIRSQLINHWRYETAKQQSANKNN